MAREPTCCCGRVRITIATVIIAVIYSIFGSAAIVLALVNKVPDDDRIAFFVYGVLQVIMASILIAAALRKWSRFMWLFFVFSCICLAYAVVILLISISNQWHIEKFLQDYKWQNKDDDDQATKGHIIQGIYSIFLFAYIVFTVFALIVVKKSHDYFKATRKYGTSVFVNE
ncbi:hypothetical protein QR680_008449 [Steinernema hermaphroditum]|uniref:Uncharacterized protein n=1 Tax=Steinernema hermaphroditum TaxID=289476 RepID=A0AA39M818_9BILA|nr:hypothetical protein QR680_008449 [Steinernema hermaphroditum]